MPRVLVTPTMLRNESGPFVDVLESGGFEVVFPGTDDDTMAPGRIGELLEDNIHAMLASTESLTREVLNSSSLRAVARMGVGYDSIDTAAATELKIAVTITPGTLEASVAEHTIALMLAVSRGLLVRDKEVRAGEWARTALPRMSGKTFGLVGLGRIGRAVVPLVKALGMNVIAHDPFPNEAFAAEHQVTLCSLNEVLTEADVVSLHSPCTEETQDLINEKTLGQMKQGAIFVNTSRGGLVDEDALCDAVASGHLLGAALDVFKEEPLCVDSPLLEQPNIVTCTHMGGIDCESQVDASRLAAQCIVDLHHGRWPSECAVTPALADGWQW